MRTDSLGWNGATVKAHLTLPHAQVNDARLGIQRMARDTPNYVLSAGLDESLPSLRSSYGISLHGQRVFGPSGRRRDILLASGLKLLVMPVIAWVVADFVFHLSAQDVLVVTVLAALPTAQNVFNYAQRFDVGETIARDTVFLTTVGCIPILLFITVLLG